MTQPVIDPPVVQPITVAGRKFLPVAETTYEQDMVIMQLLSAAGLMDYARNFDPTRDDLDKVAEDLVIAAFRSGKIFEILAATLVEENVPWSVNQVIVNGQFFANLKKRADKDALRGALVGVLFGFFVSGVTSSVTSRKFSVSTVTPPAEHPATRDPNGVLLTSESGPPSSASLASTTAADTPPSSSGISGSPSSDTSSA